MRSFILLIATTVSVQAQQTIRLSLGANVEMELVQIAPGKFTQGESSESQREVTVTQPFYIGKNPVTRGEFARFAAATNYRTESERGPSGGFGWEGGKLVQNKRYTWRTPGFPQADDHPVVMIDFSDAKAFCAWLSRQSGRTIALPTEAQWEYAARANWSATDAWHVGNSPTGTQPVGAKAPNGWGLYDMTGNAWEWCEDWFAPYTPAAAIDPLQKNPNLSDKPRRVLRGGAFSRPAAEATVGKRFRNDPGSRNADNGFRVVAFNAPPQPPPPAPAPVTLEHVQPPTPAPNRPATRDVPGALTIPNGQEQESYEAPHSSRGPGMLVWLAIAGALLVLWRVIKGISRSLTANPLRTSAPAPMPPASASDGPFTIRVVQDGFWIRARVAPGTNIRARWFGSSTMHSRTFGYRPGGDGHFVFTASQPSNVTVSLDENDDDNSSFIPDVTSPLNPLSTHHIDPTPPRNSGFTGFPPAY